MNRDSITWAGPMPAVTTAFHADFSLDEDSFVANAKRLLDAGATGIVAAGCTGEFWSLSFAERARLAELTVEVCKGRGAAIVGTGAITQDEVIDQIDAAHDLGADGVLVLPPYFTHLTEAEMIAHFEAVADKSRLPIALYNIPGNAGNAITPSLADRLADLDPVVAIKESSGNWANFHRTLVAVKDRIRVFCGPSSAFGVAASLAGADGHIDCFPNVWADCLQLWHATAAGRMDEAWALQATGMAMTDLFIANGRTLYPSTKALMNAYGLPGAGALRPPLRSLGDAAVQELMTGMTHLVPDTKRVA